MVKPRTSKANVVWKWYKNPKIVNTKYSTDVVKVFLVTSDEILNIRQHWLPEFTNQVHTLPDCEHWFMTECKELVEKL